MTLNFAKYVDSAIVEREGSLHQAKHGKYFPRYSPQKPFKARGQALKN